MLPNRFNLRVYGLWIIDRKQVLLSEERRGGYEMLKFPGGGLEFGEGLSEGLQREWMEELGMEIRVGELFYLNDFLQISAFNPRDQLLSAYFLVDAAGNGPATHESLPPGPEDAQIFRWVDIASLLASNLTFPIDRVVVEKLKKEWL